MFSADRILSFALIGALFSCLCSESALAQTPTKKAALRTRVLVCSGLSARLKVAGGEGALCTNGKLHYLVLMANAGLVKSPSLKLFTLILRTPRIADVPGLYVGMEAGASHYHLGLFGAAFRKLSASNFGDDGEEVEASAPAAYLLGPAFTYDRGTLALNGATLRISRLAAPDSPTKPESP